MKIVIDIPEEDFNNIEPFFNGETIKGGFNLFNVLRIIKNGTPLPKGHWDSRTCKCSECGYQIAFLEYAERKYNFCPNCGAKMVEPQESEDKE